MRKLPNGTGERAIELLLSKVEEVINNNDWPTEEGHVIDDDLRELTTSERESRILTWQTRS